MQIASAPLDLHSLTKHHQKHFLEMSYATLRYIQSQRHWVFTPWKSFRWHHVTMRSVIEIIAMVEHFENGRGFSLRVLRADELRHRSQAACPSGVIGKITWRSGVPRFEHRH
jgi:hypothetical protein